MLSEGEEKPLFAFLLSPRPRFSPDCPHSTAMPKEDAIHVPAQVLGPLGVAAYRMRLSNGYELVAHVTRKLQPVIGPIQPGDQVDLELSPFDLSRGRIIGRSSPSGSAPDTAG